MKNELYNKSILITGGTGSFGKAFVRYLLNLKKKDAPRRIVVFSRDELKQFEMAKDISQEKYSNIRYFLGDVRDKTVPKMTMVSAAKNGGAISTRTFIPHRCHASIGVLGAVSVATACLLPGSPAHSLAKIPDGNRKSMSIEHPIGETTVIAMLDNKGDMECAAVLRTARKLFDGEVFTQ